MTGMDKPEGIIDITEVLRYLGAGQNAPPNLRRQVTNTSNRLMSSVQPRWTWRAFTLFRENRADTALRGGFFLYAPGQESAVLTLDGKTADTMLSSCTRAVLMACTLGTGFDNLLRSSQARAMSDAVILDACGSAWVEAGCGMAEQEIAERFPSLYLTDRFSPGYGDLPLTLQRDICGLLDTPRRLGVTVTDSLLLNPAKTVTAIIGVSVRPQMARVRGCGYCAMRENCAIRERGQVCTG